MSVQPLIKKPCVLIEQVPVYPAIRAWEAALTFDDTDDGRLEPLRVMRFELLPEDEQHGRRNARPYRLYDNCGAGREGQLLPSHGGQWHGDADSALDRATHVARSYASTRLREIEAHHQAVFMERWRNRDRAIDLSDRPAVPQEIEDSLQHILKTEGRGAFILRD